MNKSVSPSRTYVAMCNKTNFDGYYFRRFKLPEESNLVTGVDRFENNSEIAASYFLNALDFTAAIEGCFTAEDLGPAAELVKEVL